jgi:gliding motility-associated-like protein
MTKRFYTPGFMFFLALFLAFAATTNAQVLKPFSIQHQVNQKGSLKFLANSFISCNACAATAEVPPAGTGIDNNFTGTYVDVDGDPLTFSSSSDSLTLPNCSEVTYAALYWGGYIQVANPRYAIRDSFWIKVNNGSYLQWKADSLYTSTASTYHCFKDITALVKSNPSARFTLANLVGTNSGTNRYGGWTIVVVYKNDNLDMRNITIFDGLTNVSSGNPITDFSVSGFLTPPTGPVTFELGAVTYDGDRGGGGAQYRGDTMLFNGTGVFRPISDAINPVDDVFNSTIGNNGVLTPYRLPNYNNTLGFDADIFRPNNASYLYIGNNATSATLRLKTGGETYLTDVVTMAIDVYEADVRMGNVATDINGGALNSGDTVEYTITVKNIGSDTSFNSLVVDTLPFNVDYVPGSMRVFYGPNSGAKTDASGDDQAEYDAATRTLRYRIGRNATAVIGGQIGNSPLGDDSTVIKFSVLVSKDCRKLSCSLTIPNQAWITGTSKISNNNYKAGSNPAVFDGNGCPIPGTTIITATASGCIPTPDTTLTSVCPAVLVDISADTLNHPGYTYFNSSFAPVSGLVGAGTYYGILNVNGLCNDTIQITALVVNCPPNAVNDAYSTNEDVVLNGTTVGANDTDPNSNINPSGYILSANAANGSVTVNANGTFAYTPATNFNGTDSFTYSVCDLGTPVYCDTATVVITVNAVNDAPVLDNETHTIPEDGSASGDLTDGGDSDPDGTPLAATTTPVVAPANGGIVINADGTYTYTPNPNFNGTDLVVVEICDAGLPLPSLCANDTIFITVNPVNDPPIVDNEMHTIPEDGSATGDLTNAGDSDPDGTALTATTTPVVAPSNGSIVINSDGTYTYTPNTNYNGTDIVVVEICDAGIPGVACVNDTIFISITPVNDAPVANDDVNTTAEETPVNGNVSPNDSDVDAPGATYTNAGGPSNGTIVVNTDGTYTYTPDADFNGNDTILISVCDGGTPNLCDTSLLVITVTPLNDTPVAIDDVNTTAEETPVNGNVSPNDSDVDGPGATYTNAGGPSNGTIVVNTDGTYTYTPDPDFNGNDTVLISVCDGGTPNLCDTSLLVITVTPVNDAPVANDDVNTTSEDTPVNGTVVTNDSDVDGPAINITTVSGPSNGIITLNLDGTYTYTPNTGFNGSDTITYSYCDGGAPDLCDTAILVISVGAVNDAPIANDDVNTTNEDTPVTGDVSINDIDTDGPSENITTVSGPNNGSITLNNDGTYTYTPTADFNGNDTVVYSYCDAGTSDLCDTATLVITVNPVNDPPVVDNETHTIPEDGSATGDLTDAGDSDPDGTTLTAATTPLVAPTNGGIVINTDGTYTYTPNTNYNGTDIVVVEICDAGIPGVSCVNDTIFITTTPVNDAPIANDDAATTDEDTPVNIPVLNNDSDVDNPLQPPVVVNNPASGTVTVNADSTITFTPNLNFNGSDTFTYVICDGGTPNLCDTATVIITVNPINDAPIATDNTNTTDEETAVSGNVYSDQTSDSDVDGPGINITPLSGPSNGIITLNTDGSYTYTPGTGFNGNDTVVYSYCDGGTPNLCDTAELVITVAPVNDAPVANDDNATTDEDTPVNVPVLNNDSDVDNPLQPPVVVTSPNNGTVTVNADSTITYTPNLNFNGSDTFTYVICDGGTPNLCDTATVIITINAINDAPIATDNTNTTDEETAVSGNVYSDQTSDSDVDGPSINITPVSGPSNGVITLNLDGSYTYTPNAGFNGNDTVTYSYCDGGTPDLCDTAELVITVAPVNDAPVAADDVATTDEDTPVNIPVLTNDSDVDNPLQPPVVVTNPSNGTVTVNADSTITYTPNLNFNGSDTFTYVICDGGTPNLCDTATVIITINAINDAPIATDNTNTTDEETAVSGNVYSDQTSDSDVDGPSINITPVSGPSNGTITLNTDGSYTYTPNAGFNGNDTVTYSYCDGGTPDLCDTAELVITVVPVNDAPVAEDDNATTDEDTPVNVPVLNNDSDVDNPLQPPVVVTNPSNGTVTVNSDSTITYTPDLNFNGSDTFTYVICDGGTPNLCDTATVIVTINAINDAPIATDNTNTTDEETAVSGNVYSDQTSDSDVDGPSINITPVSGPSNGTITLNTDGSYTYTPNTGFNGNDTITYSYCDGGTPDLCDTAELVITVAPVNDAPVADDDAATTDEDTPVNVPVLNNDSDVDNPLQPPVVVNNPANGTVTVNSDSTITYTPDLNFNGSDTFTYVICDGGTPNLCDTATVIITINVINDAPIAVDDVNSTNEETPVNGDVSPNDSDIDGPSVNVTTVSGPSNGVITLNLDGSYTYTPNTGFNGNDTVTYSYCDGGTPDLCDTAELVITVVPVNDAPVADDDAATTDEDTPVNVPVLNNDSDVDNPLQPPVVVTNPSNGTVTVNSDSTITYTPNLNFNGSDTFTYVICDGGTPNLCDTATVIITVNPINDAPIATHNTNTTDEETAVSGNVYSDQTSDSDVDGPSINITPVSGPSNGTITLNTDGSYTYTPNTGFNGNDTVTYSYCDGGTPDLCDTAELVITVVPVNDAPVIGQPPVALPEDSTITFCPTISDPDAGDVLTVSICGGPDNGTAILTGNCIDYTPNANFNGDDSICLIVCDNGSPVLCDTIIVPITVTPVNDAPVAVDDINSTNEETPVNGDVSPNDSDIDGPSVNITTVSGPSNGTITLNTDGSYTYTPNAGFNGNDTVTYSYCDGGTPDLCDTAELVITVAPVNDAPVAADDAATTDEDTPVNIPVLNNDSDVDNPLQPPVVVTNPSNGTVTVNADSTITYTPDLNFNGNDTFTYVICDGGTPNLCDTATVIITVNPINDAPIAVDDAATTQEETPIAISVLANDTDAEGNIDPTPAVIDGPSNGVITVNADGTITYTPNAGFNGLDTFTYVICDSGLPVLCDTAIVIVTVNPVNDPPVAVDDNITTPEDNPVIINVLANDTDPEGNIVPTPAIIDGPDNGTATVNADGSITYTPDSNYTGTDTFTYVICDDGVPSLCDTAVVVVTITPVADPPVLTPGPVTTAEDSTVTACFPFVTDNGLDSVSVNITCGPTNGTVSSIYTDNGSVCITYTPNLNYNGPDSVCITLCDLNNGICVTEVIPIIVTPLEDPCYWIKGFSPNGDGQNDNLFINCNESFPDATLNVFNRWGDEVWRSNGHYNNDWNGTNMVGEVLPDGTYYYIYKYNDGSGRTHAGFTTITR